MTNDIEMHAAASEAARTLFPREGAPKFTAADVKLLHKKMRAVAPADRMTVATHLIALAIMAHRAWREAGRPIVEALATLVVILLGDPNRAAALFEKAGLDRAAQNALGTKAALKARSVEKQTLPQLRLLRNGGNASNDAP